MTRGREPGAAMRLAALLILACASPALAGDAHPVARAPELLRRAVPEVERACGARFRTAPRVVELTEREALAAFTRDLAGQVERRFQAATPGQRATLLRLEASSSVRSCLARFSFAAESIVIVRASFDRQREAAGVAPERAEELLLSVLAHEAVHALDHERFDLEAFYEGAADDDGLRARAMVAEGRATHFGRLAGARLGLPEDVRELLPGGGDQRDLAALTLHLTYRLGAEFVAALVERDGVQSADRAVRAPPASTHLVCRPGRWPDPREDTRPAALLRRAELDEGMHGISELLLRARHSSLHDPATSDALFAEFRGGSQVLTDDTNAAVLAFATPGDAARYVAIAGEEAPTRAVGSLVVRAFGAAADDVLARLLAAAETESGPVIRNSQPDAAGE